MCTGSNELLQKLRDKGNTVLVVEHDPDVIKVADHVVDVGPRAGSRGGNIVYEGSYAGLLKADTLTGRYCATSYAAQRDTAHAHRASWPSSQCQCQQSARMSAWISRRGVLTVVTGVAGSGKSSLIHQAFLTPASRTPL